MLERFIYKTFLLEQDVRKQLRACPPFLILPVYIPSRKRAHDDRLPVTIPARERKCFRCCGLNTKHFSKDFWTKWCGKAFPGQNMLWERIFHLLYPCQLLQDKGEVRLGWAWTQLVCQNLNYFIISSFRTWLTSFCKLHMATENQNLSWGFFFLVLRNFGFKKHLMWPYWFTFEKELDCFIYIVGVNHKTCCELVLSIKWLYQQFIPSLIF